MNNITPPTSGKILVHQHGTGVLTRGDVQQRADEIALTEGRSSPTPEDLQRAQEELSGASLPPTSDVDSVTSLGITRDPSEPPANYGSEKPNIEAADEQKSLERLVSEGVEEAQHEQMVAARRRQHRET